MKVLVIDNYDSFVYNLVQYIGELGGDPVVYRNDQITLEEAVKMDPAKIVISPGPGDPQDPKYFGVCSGILKEMSPTVPTLGVCLGHQCIGQAFGGKIVRAPAPMHGKVSEIHHERTGIFRDIPSPFTATRYHSLMVSRQDLPDCLEVTAESDDGVIQGLAHRTLPIHGVQFHPESIASEHGHRLLGNFLDLSKGKAAA